MKKRKLVSSIIIISILLIGYLLIASFSRYVRPLWHVNKIKVTTTQPLEKEQVKVYFGFNTINRENDLDVFKNIERYVFVFYGEEKEKLITDYGENDFLITYNDSWYLSFRHYKFNRHPVHVYNIHIEEQEGVPFVRVKIKGTYSDDFEDLMIPIADAEKYRCNVPVESAGCFYNGIELID